MGSTLEQQIIASLVAVMLTGIGALLGNRVPKWAATYRQWHSDRAVLLADHERAKTDLAEVIRQRDDLRLQLTSAHQGSDINRALISDLQEQINELRVDFTQRINDAIKYSVDLTFYIRDGATGTVPDPPDSISSEVREEITSRLEHRDGGGSHR